MRCGSRRLKIQRKIVLSSEYAIPGFKFYLLSTQQCMFFDDFFVFFIVSQLYSWLQLLLEKKKLGQSIGKQNCADNCKGVCDQVCPGNTNFKVQITNQPSHELDSRFDTLLTNASELIYFGNQTTCNIVESLLSTALDKNFLKRAYSFRVQKVRGDRTR